jgi:DNA-binding NarL/FixJ family response regulator
MDGFQLLHCVQQRIPHHLFRFVFLTGRWDKQTEERAYASGAAAIFLKTCQSQTLSAMAHALRKLLLPLNNQ